LTRRGRRRRRRRSSSSRKRKRRRSHSLKAPPEKPALSVSQAESSLPAEGVSYFLSYR